MKIPFNEVASEFSFLDKELLQSLKSEHYSEKVLEDRFWDVKLLVNGIETEPLLFNDMMTRLDEYIEYTAKHYIKEKLSDAENAAKEFSELISQAKQTILEKYNL